MMTSLKLKILLLNILGANLACIQWSKKADLVIPGKRNSTGTPTQKNYLFNTKNTLKKSILFQTAYITCGLH